MTEHAQEGACPEIPGSLAALALLLERWLEGIRAERQQKHLSALASIPRVMSESDNLETVLTGIAQHACHLEDDFFFARMGAGSDKQRAPAGCGKEIGERSLVHRQRRRIGLKASSNANIACA